MGLRSVAKEDLEPDHLLAGFFLIDFQHLTELERRILLEVAEHTVISEAELLRNLSDQSPESCAHVSSGAWRNWAMYVQVMGQWTVGNEYLRRWLRQEWESLRQVQATALDESSFEQLLQLGHTKETRGLSERGSKLGK